jgi:hypothetical protein
MPSKISRIPLGSIALSIAIAIAALILTSFFDAAPNGTGGGTLTFDVASGGRWCAPQDALGTRNCRYQSFEHCLAAARIVDGTCRPNPAALTISDDGPYRTYRTILLTGRGSLE